MSWNRMQFLRRLVDRPTFRRRPSCRPMVELLEDRVLLATRTWDGSASSSWINPANWAENAAPAAFDDLVFPSGAFRNLVSNDSAAGTTYRSIAFSGSGYVVSGNSLSLTAGISSSNAASGNQLSLPITVAISQRFSSLNAGTSLVFLAVVNLNASRLAIDGAGDTTMVGVIVGTGGLTKDGTGTLTLGGAASNSYSDDTLVHAGTLVLAKSNSAVAIPGDITIGDGTRPAVVRLNAPNEINPLVAVSVSGSGLLDLSDNEQTIARLAGGGRISLGNAPLIVGSGLYPGTISGTGTVTKNSPNPLGLTGSSDYLGITVVEEGTLTIRSDRALGSDEAGTIVLSGATLAVEGGILVTEPLELNGDGFAGGGALRQSFNALDNTWAGDVSLSSDASIGVAEDALTISGVISDGGAARNLTKIGSGTLRFSGLQANSYSGTTRVNDGTLELNKDTGSNNAILGPLVIGDGFASANPDVVRSLQTGQITNDQTVTINSFGLLDLNDQVEAVGPLILAGGNVSSGADGEFQLLADVSTIAASTPATISGHLNLRGGGRTFTVADGPAADDLVIAAAIASSSNAVGMVKDGGGTLRLTGSTPNTYAGTTTVNNGRLILDKTGGDAIPGPLVIGDGSLAGSPLESDAVMLAQSDQIADDARLTINAFGFLDLGTNTETIGPLTLSGGGAGNNGGTLILNGNVTANAATVPSTINGNLSLGNSSRTFIVADGAAAPDLDITAGISGDLGVGLTKRGAGSLRFSGEASDSNTYTGTTTVNEGVLELNKPAPATAIFGALVVDGFLGGTHVDLLSPNQIADTASVTLTSSGALDLMDNDDTVGGLNLVGGHVINHGLGGILTLDGDVSATGLNLTPSEISAGLSLGAASRTFSIARGLIAPFGNDLVITGSIRGGPGAGLIKNGAGSLELRPSTSNTFTGVTVVNEATLFLRGDPGAVAVPGDMVIGDGVGTDIVNTSGNKIGSASTVTVRESGSLLLLVNGTEAIGALILSRGVVFIEGGARLALNGNITARSSSSRARIEGGGTLDLGGATRSLIVEAPTSSIDSTQLLIATVITGGAGVGLTKSGAGTLVLTSANTYTGATTINSGTAVIGGNQPSSPVIVLSGGRLSGDGTVGSITAATSAAVSPGILGTGQLHASGDVAFNSSTGFVVEIFGTGVRQFDSLDVTGQVSLGGSTLAFFPNITPAIGDSFTIINNDGTDAVAGTFAGLPEGLIFTTRGVQYQISYAGGTGNDVVLTVVDTIGPTINQLALVQDARRRKVTAIVLTFSERLVESSAENPPAYTLASASARRPKPIAIGSVDYDPLTATVRLTLQKPLAKTKLSNATLTVAGGSGLVDLADNSLDGDADGTPGGDFTRRLSLGVILSMIRRRDAIDELLACGELPGCSMT